MSGFTVGDIFGKNFLSAETIIGGRRAFGSENKQTFNASVSNISSLGTSITLADLIMYYQGQAGTTAQQDAAKAAIAGLKVKQNNSNISISTLTSGTGKNLFRFSSNDTIVLDKKGKNGASGDQAFHIKPASGYSMKFRIKVYDKTYLSSRGHRPKNTAGKDLADASSMTNGGYANISGYTKDSNGETIEVILNGDDGDYISVDMGEGGGKNNSGIAAFKVVVKGAGTFEGKPSQPRDYMNTVAITLRSLSKNQSKGCKDSDADNSGNYDVADNTQCAYTTASVTSFNISKTSMKVGDPAAKITWNLSNGHFSEIQLLQNGTNIMPSDKKNVQNSGSAGVSVQPTTVADYKYKLKVIWDKAPSDINYSSEKTLNVQAAQSYVQCTDPNRNKDANGECGPCKSGYYLDTASGLCTQCDDPNREKDSSGRCGSCKSGYALKDGLCQKAGCTTEGNYNYDGTAVIHDESMCYDEDSDGTGGGQTGGTGGTDGTGGGELIEVLPDENGDAISSQVEPEPSKFPVVPVVGAVALIGVLLLRRG